MNQLNKKTMPNKGVCWKKMNVFGIDETVITIFGLTFGNLQHYSKLKLNTNYFPIITSFLSQYSD